MTIKALAQDVPTGSDTFYAIPVLAGKDVMNGFNRIGKLAHGTVTPGR